MNRKNHNNKKELIIIIFAVVLVGILIVTIIFLSNRDQDTFEYEGWIDCQPILSPEEEDLCRRAEAAGYPYIAY